MAYAELKSEIQIGTWKFTGVHEVRIKRGINGYSDSAVIKLPTRASIKKGGHAEVVVTGSKFDVGDLVNIKLGYSMNGLPAEMHEEFEGFVKRMNSDMPMEIECEGYVRQLRQNIDLYGTCPKTTCKELLDMATGKINHKKEKVTDRKKMTDIQVKCDIDFPISTIHFPHSNGAHVLDKLKGELSCNTLATFFIEPCTLWVGLVYGPTQTGGKNIFDMPTVKYKLGYNTKRDSGLKERIVDEPVHITINGVNTNGEQLETASQLKYNVRKEKHTLNTIPDKKTLTEFANERATQLNYAGYEGTINAFLRPFCLPGYTAKIIDDNYPKRNGEYLVISTEVIFGINGAQRKVGIGPKIS